MKKIVAIFLVSLFIFQSCNNEKKPMIEKGNSKILSEERFCYINSIKRIDNNVIAEIDFITYQKITDLDSNIKHSQIIELPNGFCYANEKIILEEFEIKDNVSIIMQTISYNNEGNFNFNQKINLLELVEQFCKPDGDRIKFSPFRIKLENKNIIALTEIYIP